MQMLLDEYLRCRIVYRVVQRVSHPQVHLIFYPLKQIQRSDGIQN